MSPPDRDSGQSPATAPAASDRAKGGQLNLASQLSARGIPVLLTSASTPREPCPSVGFLAKPFDIDDLLRAVDAHLGKDGASRLS